MNQDLHIQEQSAAKAFGKQAVVFDKIYGNDLIVQYKRQRVRDHLQGFLQPGSTILELNAGTGEDAIWLAGEGHRVHATDLSEDMLRQLNQKVNDGGMQEKISSECCSFNRLDQLMDRGPYDLVFSNFAGLNCSAELKKILGTLKSLVKPGGMITLVLLPRFCLWEFLLLFRGKFRTAFRRFAGKKGAPAKVEGEAFRCWYYNPSFVKKVLQSDFELQSLEGLCTLVPPSYLEHFGERHPKWFRRLTSIEERWKRKWPWRGIGDYYIISLQRKK